MTKLSASPPLALSTLFVPLLIAACSSTSASDDLGGTGGVLVGTGGAPSGGAATGGASTGGVVATGGVGVGGTGGTPATGGVPSTESEGCGTATTQQTGTWVESMVSVDGENRPYSTWLPPNYDPARAYPVIFLLHGCGSGTNNLPMETRVGEDAIVFRGTGSRDDGCWHDTPGGDESDMPYIDAMVADVEARFCVETKELFAVGYSSGSWVVNQLACVRSDVWRGLASVTGGEPPLPEDCGGPVARMFVHDAGDGTNLIAWSRSARDRMLETNECDAPPATMPVEPSPCVTYQGCLPDYPVVWCETTGQGHNRQDNFAAPAFWNFFQSLRAEP